MHCKFWIFFLFPSACELRFIERIGAHGKQNPDFIIMLLLLFLGDLHITKRPLKTLNLCFEAITLKYHFTIISYPTEQINTR